MSEELAVKLNDCKAKGYVIAPAGYGKTHLIALATRISDGKQLVLTHTFAGVNSIRAKMTSLGVPTSKYQIDTIASWSLRLCLAYPKTSGWNVDNPTDEQWNQLYGCCSVLLAKLFIRHAISASYAGTSRGESAILRKTTKYPSLLLAANVYLEDPTSRHLIAFFLELKANPETGAYRRDLLFRLLHVLKMHSESEGSTLLEVGKIYQRDMRHTGRPISHRKLIGTTLLVKGLEFDHAVILDADSLDAKHLYVAMTRGSKSLTIIGNGRHVPVERVV